ncbi:hypothetical protein ACLB1E_08830 [Escherichia coli]
MTLVTPPGLYAIINGATQHRQWRQCGAGCATGRNDPGSDEGLYVVPVVSEDFCDDTLGVKRRMHQRLPVSGKRSAVYCGGT